jgi:hypothetical protein
MRCCCKTSFDGVALTPVDNKVKEQSSQADMRMK